MAFVKCKFFRLNFPFGRKSKPVKRFYFRFKKERVIRFPVVLKKSLKENSGVL